MGRQSGGDQWFTLFLIGLFLAGLGLAVWWFNVLSGPTP